MPILAVAPHWGAWIEIQYAQANTIVPSESHPTGVRGLKLMLHLYHDETPPVAPHWGAWIEIRASAGANPPSPSHPTGVRGLKFR